jgi:putative transposase
MSKLRRYYTTGNYYFITTVTLDRQPILVQNIDLYHKAIDRTGRRFDLEIIAWVVLPDHLHLLLNPKINNLSNIMKVFKQDFGFLYRQRLGRRTGSVWQLCFWDHIIRNQADLNRHIDYIHYNPIKHGIASSTREYVHSSFADYVRDGYYETSWGEKKELDFEGEFGE